MVYENKILEEDDDKTAKLDLPVDKQYAEIDDKVSKMQDHDITQEIGLSNLFVQLGSNPMPQ